MLHTVEQIARSSGINYNTLCTAIVRLQLEPTELLPSGGRPYRLFTDAQVEQLLSDVHSHTVAIADVLEDLRLLAGAGVGATEAAGRVGYRTPTALYRALHRHGYHSLARRLYANEGAAAKASQYRRAA
jgi:hypothetical protein